MVQAGISLVTSLFVCVCKVVGITNFPLRSDKVCGTSCKDFTDFTDNGKRERLSENDGRHLGATGIIIRGNDYLILWFAYCHIF
jgi:hypothetical protein